MDARKSRGLEAGRRRRRVRLVGTATAALLAIPCALAVHGSGAASGSAVAYFGLTGGTSAAYRSDGIGGAWFLDPASNLPDVGTSAAPTLVDLDGNGVLDALVGEVGGNVRALRNGGTDIAPAWSARPAWDAPKVSADAAPAAADLDGDGDFDLLVGTTQGDVVGVQNIGSRTAPAWSANPAWNFTGLGTGTRPAAGDVNADGRVDVMVGSSSGATFAFLGSGNAAQPLVRTPAWDVANLGVRVTPAAADLNGDRRADLLLINTTARVVSVQRSTGSGFVADTTFVKPPDAGSGPGGLAFAVLGTSAPPPPTTTTKPTTPTTPTTTATTTTTKPTTPPTPGVVAKLTATPATGAAPLSVLLDASGSVANPSGPLTYSWDFGDGSPPPPPAADNGARLTQARADYMAADAMRAAGQQVASVPSYMNTVAELLPLTNDTSTAPFTKNGLTTIDKIARYYLSIIGHDLGGIYRYHAVPGFESGCLRYQTAYLYLLESIEQARLGGISNIPAGNGTVDKKNEALAKLSADGCAVPPYRPMYAGVTPPPGGTAPTVAKLSHIYTTVGTYAARVSVSNGTHTASATAQITVTNGTPPTTKPPTTTTSSTTPGTVPPGGGGGSEPLQGFGASTRGGEGGNEFVVSQPTSAAVKSAITAANSNSNAGRKSKIIFTTPGPIAVSSSLLVAANNLTIEGNGVTLDGAGVGVKAALLEINGHDVIVRNMHLRNGGDNLRAQDAGAYNIVFSHVSVTGGRDDGISIGYGAHDVTVQYSFLAGNSRSIFIKYKGTTNVSLHHNWVQKQWIRGPWAMDAFVDFRNNIVEDWAGWGARWEGLAAGNVVNSLFAQGPYATSQWGGTGSKALNIIASSPVYVSGIEYRGNAKAGANAQGNVGAPVGAPAVDTQSVAAMEPMVRAKAGAMPRDAIDKAYIALTGGWAFNGFDHAPSDFGL